MIAVKEDLQSMEIGSLCNQLEGADGATSSLCNTQHALGLSVSPESDINKI